jgi:predicted DsbA family dithiol-disulfide isomerase
MQIEVWSDVVCPWCYIGKRRLESALAGFAHAGDVEVVYRSFELDPTAPQVGTETVTEALEAKYGGGPGSGAQMMARVAEVAAGEGLHMDHGHATHTKTVDAHRLLHLALHQGGPGLQATLKEALLDAYFSRAESMGDHDVLRRVAVGAGLPADRVEEVLAGDAYTDEVARDIAQARAYGATGVPFYVVDQRYGLSGAQPVEVFAQLLDQAWADAHPALTLVDPAGSAGDACGPDGCAL